MRKRLTSMMAGTAMILSSAPLAAQDQTPHMSVELNAAQPQDDACKLSFLVQSTHEAAITKVVYETVIFDASGQVNRLTLFDFGALPPGRPRVRQFVIPATACDGIGQILFNGAQTCDGAGLPEGACSTGLELKTRTEIEVIG
ncbi:hypothetical protein [Pseudooceanicola onchidii]|uniref:hypothetical protein n=1 Tax=Pseudooceanicola onchidii TaxID=2562279 RepID=UPI0010A9CCBB|nr:hypothetical protein [Pseudooceanicola onchidii]